MKRRIANPKDFFSKAWQITWENKILWVFGFFAGLRMGNGNDSSSSFIEGGSWLFQNIGSLFKLNSLNAVLTIIFALIFWLLGTLARISIIHEVSALDVRNPKPVPSIKESIRVSSKFFVHILLMQLLVFSPLIVVSLATHVFTQPISKDFQNSVNASNFPSFFSGIMLISVVGILIAIPLIFIDAFAYRGIVLDGLEIKDSIKNAVQVIRANQKFIFQLSLICLIAGAIFTFVVGIILSPLLLFMTNSMAQNASQCSAFKGNAQAMANCMRQIVQDPTLVTVNTIANIIAAALSSIFVMLQSASFTLAYKKFVTIQKPA